MVYYQDFNDLSNAATYVEILQTLGWKALFREDKGVPADWPEGTYLVGASDDHDLAGNNNNCSGLLSVVDGKIFVDNNNKNGSATLNGNPVADATWQMIPHSYMELADQGDYTIQYDLTFGDCGARMDYATLVASYMHKELGYPGFYSAHIRQCGAMNHQIYLEQAGWMNLNNGSPIAGNSLVDDLWFGKRIFGFDWANGGTEVVRFDPNTTITVTWVMVKRDSDFHESYPEWEQEVGIGYHIYINGILASVANPNDSDGFFEFWDNKEYMPSSTICLKAGNTAEFYIDNIMVWTGASLTPPEDKSTAAYKALADEFAAKGE